MINSTARDLIMRHPPLNAIMYDWWIAVTLLGLGEFHELDDSLLDYRIHDQNTVGVPTLKRKAANYIKRPSKRLFTQNKQLYVSLSLELNERDRLSLKNWISIFESNLFTRIQALLKIGLTQQIPNVSFARSLAHILKTP